MPGRPVDPDRHPAQPQPRQSDAEHDDREHPETRRTGGRRRMQCEQCEDGPAAETVGPLEPVVLPGPECRQRQHDHRDQQRQDHPGEGEGGRGEGKPGGGAHRRTDVQAAEVVDLAHRPPDPQRPVDGHAGRQPEQQIDHVLLADQHREGEVGEHHRSTHRRLGIERHVEQYDGGGEPVVMGERTALEPCAQRPSGGGETELRGHATATVTQPAGTPARADRSCRVRSPAACRPARSASASSSRAAVPRRLAGPAPAGRSPG